MRQFYSLKQNVSLLIIAAALKPYVRQQHRSHTANFSYSCQACDPCIHPGHQIVPPKNKSSRLTLKTQGLKKQTAPLLFSSFFYFIFIFLLLVVGNKSLHDINK